MAGAHVQSIRRSSLFQKRNGSVTVHNRRYRSVVHHVYNGYVEMRPQCFARMLRNIVDLCTLATESMPEYNPPKMMVKPPFFDTIEFISVMIFTTEFLARVLTVSWVPDYVKFPDREATGFDNFKAFWHSPMNISRLHECVDARHLY